MSKTFSPHIHPDFTEQVSVIYTIEYTEKDEAINTNFDNLKSVTCNDLESMVKYMFQLRQLNRFNINLYTKTELNGQWITEDYANDCEIFSSSETEKKKEKSIRILEKTIEEQQKEIELYKTFLGQYNSTDAFEKWKKENKPND